VDECKPLMDGQTPVAQRMRLIDEFNTDERVFVFLLTTKAGPYTRSRWSST
jgi:SNF2 family DNA or RNA helicase